MCVPVFWVETVSVEADANMRINIVKHTVDGVTLDLPVLRNFRRIDKFEKIAVYVSQVEKDMSEPTPIGVVKGQRGKAAGVSPPQKKQRGSGKQQ